MFKINVLIKWSFKRSWFYIYVNKNRTHSHVKYTQNQELIYRETTEEIRKIIYVIEFVLHVSLFKKT